MKTIHIGPYEVMQPDRKFDYKSDLIDYVEKLGNGWKVSEYNFNRYIQTELWKYNVSRLIIKKYSITCISQVKIAKIKQLGGGMAKLIKYRSETPLDAKKFILGYDANFLSTELENRIQANVDDKDLDDYYGEQDSGVFYIVR